MKRTMTFFGLFIKRLLKKPSFVLILLLMPLIVFAFRMILKQDSQTIDIALYTYDESKEIRESIEVLKNRKSTIGFYEAESEQDVREAVLTNRAECGFVFKEGYYHDLLAGDVEEKVMLYKNTKTTLDDLAKEIIFSEIFRKIGRVKLVNFLRDKNFYEDNALVSEQADIEKYLVEHYDGYINDGGAFKVVYTGNGEEKATTIEDALADNSYLMRPVRGVLAMFMMMAALSGAVFRAIDEKQGVYKTLGYTERPWINILTVFIPALLSGIAALVCLYIGGIARGMENGNAVTGFFKELGGVFVYILLLTGLANLLRSLIANEALLCSLLPMLTVVSLLGCNIFFNAATKVKGVEELRYLLPPDYYLEKTGSAGGVLLMLVITVVLLALGVLNDRRKSA
ncbi:MAG: hypothetical protein IKR27_03110 [Lachnospiraceae bacterium]|nr:hypothetical protein [Lachnospiraceae bacterium]